MMETGVLGIHEGRLKNFHSEILTEKIIGAAIEVHRIMGPGLLESTYEACLAKEFDMRNIKYERQKSFNLSYKNMKLDEINRVDLLVENEIILEIKSVEHLLKIHSAQLLTYFRHLNLKAGLLLNFNVPYLKDGIKRVIS